MDKTTKLVRSIWMIWDHANSCWVGKPGKYGRTSQPAVYWSEGRAKTGVRNSAEKREDGTPRYDIVEMNLTSEIFI